MEPIWNVCIDNAIAWAKERLGSPSYTTRCLAFVEDAYERSNEVEVFGGDCAHESAELYGVRASAGSPPIGAFVFYDCWGPISGEHRNWGHVGLSLGDEQIIHAWDVVRIDHHAAVEDLQGGPGWGGPRYVGWAPVQRIFEGFRRNDWRN